MPMSAHVATYLEQLPHDVQRIVVQYCSERPYRDDSSRFITSRSLHTLLNVVPHGLKLAYKAICDGDEFAKAKCCESGASCTCLSMQEHPEMVYTGYRRAGDTSEFCEFIALLPTMEHIVFSWRNGVSEKSSRVVADHAVALRSLAMYDTNSAGMVRVLKSRGSMLHCLDTLLTAKVADSLLKHCTSLRHLGIARQPAGTLAHCLPAIGPNLLSLEVVKGAVGLCDIKAIGEYCRQLEKLNLGTHHSLYDLHAALLASYGLQMKEADLRSFSEEQIRTATESCPNLKATIEVEGNPRNILQALGSCACKVALTSTVYMEKGAMKMFEPCSAIRTLRMTAIRRYADEEVIHNVPRSFELASLQELVLENRRGLHKDLLKLFGMYTRELRRLQVKIRSGDKQALLGFRSLVRRNPYLTHIKVLLFNVEIREEDEWVPFGSDCAKADPDQRAEATCCELVKILVDCQHIREIVVDTGLAPTRHWNHLESLREAMPMKFRRRRVHVHVLGNDYLPVVKSIY